MKGGHPHQQLLTPEKETAIDAVIRQLNDIGIPPMMSNLDQMVAFVLKQRTSTTREETPHIGNYQIT